MAACRGKKGLSSPKCQLELADADGDGDVDNDDLKFVVGRIGECGFVVDDNIASMAAAGPDQAAIAGDATSLDGSAANASAEAATVPPEPVPTLSEWGFAFLLFLLLLFGLFTLKRTAA